MRHIYVPDTQVRPGVPTDHLAWVAAYITEKRPNRIIVGGDWWDFPSLSSYEQAGGEALEGARVEEDIWVGNEAFKNFARPIDAEIKRLGRTKTPWAPTQDFTDGNHDDRIDRVPKDCVKWKGLIGSHLLNTQNFKRHPFLKVLWRDDIAYSHFFQNQQSSKPIGGQCSNRLTKIGSSFVQGHEQILDIAFKILGNGKTITGAIAGACYVHIEKYRGHQAQQHFRGILGLNEVRNGGYLPMPVSLDFLCRKYERMSLFDYHKKKYPRQKWEHLQ